MTWIALDCCDCDGGPQLARVYKREIADEVARRYGGYIRGYGPTKAEARKQLGPALEQWEERRRERCA